MERTEARDQPIKLERPLVKLLSWVNKPANENPFLMVKGKDMSDVNERFMNCMNDAVSSVQEGREILEEVEKQDEQLDAFEELQEEIRKLNEKQDGAYPLPENRAYPYPTPDKAGEFDKDIFVAQLKNMMDQLDMSDDEEKMIGDMLDMLTGKQSDESSEQDKAQHGSSDMEDDKYEDEDMDKEEESDDTDELEKTKEKLTKLEERQDSFEETLTKVSENLDRLSNLFENHVLS